MRTRSRKLLVGLLTLALTLTSFSMVANMSTVRAAEDDGIPMYRMYNPNSGEHLHTKDEGERNWLIEIGWNYEGISFIVANEGEPVYRLYNRYSGEHHYTMDANEKSWLLTIDGWNDEGIGWYSKKTGDACEVAVYRLFNPHTDVAVSSHHYTTDANEKDWLVFLGWNYEGTSWTSMHNVITEDSVEATCTKEGYSGGARCKTCNKVYTGSVLPINSNNHLHTVYHPEEIVEQHKVAYICNICGQVIGVADGYDLPDFENTVAHINTHGYNFDAETISCIDKRDEWNLLWTLVEERTPYIVTSPAHTHCNDCGKDIY